MDFLIALFLWRLYQATELFRKGEGMDAERSCGAVGEPEGVSTPPSPAEAVAEQPRAWEMIEHGRYMPRRIRGSCHGRELG
ncbi:MAG TPA: hypothetical protein VKA46_15720 [Gemmataceae bacterium]|nr:hypothetical protein [Gemmataceae bacterium]